MAHINENEIIERLEAISSLEPNPEVTTRDLARIKEKIIQHEQIQSKKNKIYGA